MIWILLIAISVFGIIVYRSNRFQEYLASSGRTTALTNEEVGSLRRHFAFYRSLPPRSQRIFEYRVNRFRKLTKFVPRQMTQITSEMEILISASAMQLMFGFDDVFLAHFDRIIVYPDQFFSQSGQRYHKGEVNPAMGVIVLSWRHFVEGYAEDEGLNLGLHEMAHALQLENIIMNDEFGFMDDQDIITWRSLAAIEMHNEDYSFFRAYGSTDHSEFFAVAVENFFERPQAFQAYNAPLYKAMCQLLKQNPLLLPSILR